MKYSGIATTPESPDRLLRSPSAGRTKRLRRFVDNLMSYCVGIMLSGKVHKRACLAPSTVLVDTFRRRPRLSGNEAEVLESRALLKAFVVTNTNDSGTGSLRWAMQQAEALTSADSISFSSYFTGTSRVIRLTSGSLQRTAGGGTTYIVGPGPEFLTIQNDVTDPYGDQRAFSVMNSRLVMQNLYIANSGGGYYANGGGIISNNSTITLTNCWLFGNDAVNFGSGGAIYATNGGSVIISASLIGRNEAYFDGGAISISSGVSLAINTTGIYDNEALSNGGGGISFWGTSANISNSTISKNWGSGGGGGLKVNSGGVTIWNSTIANNKATNGAINKPFGGGIYVASGGVTLKNTLLSGNTLKDMNAPTKANDVYGNIESLGNNGISNTANATGFTSFDVKNVDMKIGELETKRHNGQYHTYHPLLAGSPALNAGGFTNETSDQRYFPRQSPTGLQDIGAIEVQWPTNLTLSTTTVNESASVLAAPLIVGTLSVTDPDSSSHTFSLEAGEGSTHNSKIEIVGNTLQIKAGETLDFEQTPNLFVRIRAVDSAGGFDSKQLTISVANINELPAELSISTGTIAENQPAGTTAGQFSTVDPDIADSFMYSLVDGEGSNDNSAFEISGSVLKSAASFDFETRNSYSIRVRSTDSGGLWLEKIFAFTITNEPDGTSGSDAFVITYFSTHFSVTVATDSGPIVDMGDIPLTSPFSLLNLSESDSVRVVGTTGDDKFLLEVSGVSVNGAQLVLDGPAKLTIAGGPGDDCVIIDADSPLGIVTFDEAAGGTDLIDFSQTTSAVEVSLGLATTQVVNSNLSLVLGSAEAFEKLTGGSGNDSLTGNAGGNELRGNAGNDRLTGNGGDDSLIGGLGDDAYLFGAASTAELDTVEEGMDAGTDTLSFSTLTTDVVLNLGTSLVQTIHSNRSVKLNSGSTFENTMGGAGNDWLSGNSLANVLTGSGGNDRLTGNGGNDSMNGGLGDDTYVFGLALTAEADMVTEGTNAGIDTLSFTTLKTDVMLKLGTSLVQTVHSNRSVKLNSGLTFENAVSGTGNDLLTGNSLANVLTGNSGNDRLTGHGGSDSLNGGLGDDTYEFGVATTVEADSVNEGSNAGTDTLSFSLLTTDVVLSLGTNQVQIVHSSRSVKLNSGSTFENAIGGSGHDTLAGNSMANVLAGNSGHDILIGNSGDDTLSGGNGLDILIGGLGLDTLRGGNDEDIVIAGRTTNDGLFGNLNDLRTEWTSPSTYANRLSNLRTGVGVSTTSLKAKLNVLDDAATADTLIGGAATDWYFSTIADVISDLLALESVDVL